MAQELLHQRPLDAWFMRDAFPSQESHERFEVLFNQRRDNARPRVSWGAEDDSLGYRGMDDYPLLRRGESDPWTLQDLGSILESSASPSEKGSSAFVAVSLSLNLFPLCLLREKTTASCKYAAINLGGHLPRPCTECLCTRQQPVRDRNYSSLDGFQDCSHTLRRHFSSGRRACKSLPVNLRRTFSLMTTKRKWIAFTHSIWNN